MNKIEERVLKATVKKIELDIKSIAVSLEYRLLIVLSIVLPLMLIISQLRDGNLETAGVITFTLICGWFSGASILIRASEQSWDFIKKYIKLDDIKKHLAEKNK